MSSKYGLKAKISIAAVSTALVMMGGTNKATAVQTLMYSGDPAGVTLLGNRANAFLADATVYQAFNVPTGQNWVVNDVFTNNYINSYPGTATQASWQILSGVSPGNSGKMIAGGTNAPSTQTTHPAGYSTIDVGGLNVSLAPGTYFLGVAPKSPVQGVGDSYIATTKGANSIGIAPSVSYINSPGMGYNFQPTSNFVNQPVVYSAGIRGTASTIAAPVPFEFSPSLGLVVLGAWGAFYKFKQAKQKSGL